MKVGAKLNRATIILIILLMGHHCGFAQTSDLPPSKKTFWNPKNSIYQYAVTVENRTAYLWIPPKCKYVRGVIIALANLLERKWLEDPIIRQTASDQGLGIIWVGPVAGNRQTSNVFTADMKPGAEKLLEKMLMDFAAESGYREMEYAPIISTGHSANGQFAWEVPNWNADRTIAAIPIKTMPLPAKLGFEGVPLCYVVGQTTEWPQYRVPDPATQPGDRDFFWPVVTSSAVALRVSNPNNLISVVVDPGGGHFDWSERMAKLIASFIAKACEYRLPNEHSTNGLVKLKSIKTKSGWLTDTCGMLADKFKPAAYSSYKGDVNKSYWFFDHEMANAAASFDGDRKARKKQMLTFIQGGRKLPVAKEGFASLKFDPGKDGLTMKLRGAFLGELPPGLIGAGAPLGHAPGRISFSVITGSAIQIDSNKFRIQFNRGDQGGAIWLQAEQMGDNEYRHAVQPAKLLIPPVLTAGQEQHITFPVIGDRKISDGAIQLDAKSDSNLPVDYYVVSGPAIIQDGLLKIDQVPVKSKFPIKITLVAYQWGCLVPPLYQSAKPVSRTFLLYR